MWLIVVLVLFAALGVWALIFIVGFFGKMIDSTFKMQKKKQNDGNTSL